MLKKLAENIYRFSYTELSTLSLFLFAYACVVLELSPLGICVLAAYICLLCLVSGDVLPTLLPMLLIYCLAFFCSASVWLVFLGIPCAVALFYRLWRNRATMRPGKTFFGLVAVAVAVTVGGLGSISAEEYFSPGSLYVMLGLGLVAVALYLLLKGSLALPRSYDVGDYVSGAMYACAVFVAFLILRAFLMNPDVLVGQDQVVDKLGKIIATWRNGAANLGVMLLPFIFYYARRHSAWNLLSAVAVFVVIALAGARAAIVIGAVMLLLGLLYFSYRRPVARTIILLAVLVCAVLALVLHKPLLAFAEDFLCISLEGYDVRDEARYKLFKRSIEDFQHSPLFGRGFGYTGNADIYSPTREPDLNAARWRVQWYHSMIPQLIGSMGIVGVLAYGYQFILRLRALFTVRRTAYTGALALAYVGVLLYSQLDPGIFSPMPFALVTVLLFALIEAEPEREKRKPLS